MKIFFRDMGGAGHMEFDTETHNIILHSSEYIAKENNRRLVQVTISEDVWRDIVKYGKDAGFLEEE